MKKTTVLICLVMVYILSLLHACQPNVSIQTAQYAVNGQKLYKIHCENCHGGKGEGLGALYPPLTDTLFLKRNRQQLPSIVKNGIDGPITVHGQVYDEKMPGVPELTDVDIAYILTYVTTTFGKQTEKFSLEEVKASLKRN